MRILEIEQLFKSEETLPQVLDGLEDDIKRIDDYASMMKDNVTNNPEEAKKALNELTGCYSNLKTVLAIAETEKKNREVRKFNDLKINFATSDTEKKFTAASADKESGAFVGEYRRIRNIVEAYAQVCEKMISTLQSLLKWLATERNGEQG
ncbi:hypothetical protein LCGC14_2332380 [marine sediment metagenome]|uniref:Uncharacterized protein n=1 Tax=marine sediment metagenome TaxID=412755 RepID=A0A0F9ES86_9ZZZZ